MAEGRFQDIEERLEALESRQKEAADTLLRLYRELERRGHAVGSTWVNGHDLLKLADAIIGFEAGHKDG